MAADNPAAASTLRGYLDKLEDLRQSRLEFATKSVPVFWWVMAVPIVGAMIMNGAINWTPSNDADRLPYGGNRVGCFDPGDGFAVQRRNERLTGFAGEGCAAVFTVVQLSKSSLLRLWESLSQDAPGLLSTSWAQHLIIGSFSNRTPANTAGVFGSATGSLRTPCPGNGHRPCSKLTSR